MDDPKPSWITRILAWLLGLFQRRDAQAAADTAQEHHLEEQTHAVEQSQASAPTDLSAFERRVRDGSNL